MISYHSENTIMFSLKIFFTLVNFIQREEGQDYKDKDEWVQCYSCRKWRVLNACFNPETLPEEWFVSGNNAGC
jgi:hypothetical protein